MKYLFSVVIILSLGVTAWGQEHFEVYYKYLNIGNNIASEAILYTDSRTSIFIFEKKEDDFSEKTDVDEEGNIYISLGSTDTEGKKIYKDFTNKKLIFRDFIVSGKQTKAVIVEEKLPELQWVLKSATKKIGKYDCALAEVDFRGRAYEVWYTKDIPIQNGPWKFQGLPGLIIEVSSKDKNVYFVLEKIKVMPGKLIANIPQSGISISFDEYVESKNKAVESFLEMLNSKLPRGAKITSISTENYNIEKKFEQDER
ncbi:MAG: GLPGLI family protein [Saprospiraceae bacterium]